ncbi:MAG: 16S rRNA (guanine(966)-N(2))-methyltransferase RsmD [Peptococcaceae bacterium]|nr:16S rRNA (guanine(966)-N(2))-methyltransferase RsmD [Peptococcaceae bacterium]
MRIIGGEAKGRILKSVRGMEVRPTAGRVREALFNILAGRVFDSRWLDLFAGSGSIGIEALSRGASRVIFVENNPKVASVLRQNVTGAGFHSRSQIMRADVIQAIQKLSFQDDKFDVVFMDPPYSKYALYKKILTMLDEKNLLTTGGVIVAESHKSNPLYSEIGRLYRVRQNRYGDSLLTFYMMKGG